ncbi:MFS transporter [Nocardioides sp. T2.26MG-1]|uniref:MFS transporter n=1 Tax=Nocardioides sp. T2.26MG-1 TaxID=3041166 RepID=UPI002477B947|nr:MFS transporter [Nocardioides sp. T2.26MG-1]CAI9398989.1 Enterobactin exporter EntS [Nocardioides sp. T2.26MG-1]
MTSLDDETARAERPRPLRHRNFRLLVTGSATSSLGNAIAPVALAFAVLDLGGSASDLGLVVAAYALADVVTVLFGGVLGDRVARQVLMEGSNAVCALSQAAVAVLIIGGWATVPLLALLGVVNGCLGALSGPSSSAMTRMTVPPDLLGSAVALRGLLQTSAAVVGYAVGGVLVAGVGPGWAIGVDAATFAVAAFCFGRLDVPHTRPEGARASMFGDMAEGLREVLRHTWLWLLIGQALLYHLFYGGAQSVVGPIVMGDEFGRSSWGLALGVLMAGFVVGGLICLRWKPRRALFIGTVLLSLTGTFPLAMALSDHLWPILVGAFLHGVGLQIFDVFWQVSIQENIAEDKLARVYSFDLVGSFIARPIGLAATGPIAEAVGFDHWLVVVGCVMSGSALISLSSGDVRRLQRQS